MPGKRGPKLKVAVKKYFCFYSLKCIVFTVLVLTELFFFSKRFDKWNRRKEKTFSVSVIKDRNLRLSLDECLRSKINCSLFVFWKNFSKNADSGVFYDYQLELLYYLEIFTSWENMHTRISFIWIANHFCNNQAFWWIMLILFTNNEHYSIHRDVEIIAIGIHPGTCFR